MTLFAVELMYYDDVDGVMVIASWLGDAFERGEVQVTGRFEAFVLSVYDTKHATVVLFPLFVGDLLSCPEQRSSSCLSGIGIMYISPFRYFRSMARNRGDIKVECNFKI